MRRRMADGRDCGGQGGTAGGQRQINAGGRGAPPRQANGARRRAAAESASERSGRAASGGADEERPPRPTNSARRRAATKGASERSGRAATGGVNKERPPDQRTALAGGPRQRTHPSGAGGRSLRRFGTAGGQFGAACDDSGLPATAMSRRRPAKRAKIPKNGDCAAADHSRTLQRTNRTKAAPLLLFVCEKLFPCGKGFFM